MHTEDVAKLAEKLENTEICPGIDPDTGELYYRAMWMAVWPKGSTNYQALARVALEFCEERGMLRRKVEPDVNPHPEIYNKEPK